MCVSETVQAGPFTLDAVGAGAGFAVLALVLAVCVALVTRIAYTREMTAGTRRFGGATEPVLFVVAVIVGVAAFAAMIYIHALSYQASFGFTGAGTVSPNPEFAGLVLYAAAAIVSALAGLGARRFPLPSRRLW